MIDPNSSNLSNTGGVGTLFFMAPEIINEENYNEKVDVYSFGVLAYFILSDGQMPNIKIRDIVNGRMAPIPPEFSQLANDLITKCWNFDPSQRPSFDEICTLLEENNYKLIDHDEASMREALDLINQHKLRIPFYSH